MNQYQQLEQLLRLLEQEMQARELWRRTPPSATALASPEPFCVDTLDFCEWVQWIMIPRFDALIRHQQPLPTSSDIATMAEEAFRGVGNDTTRILELITRIDSTLRLLH